MIIATIAGRRKTQDRVPSCHFFGSLLASQYRPPSNASNAADCDAHEEQRADHVPHGPPSVIAHCERCELQLSAASDRGARAIPRAPLATHVVRRCQDAGQLASTLSTKVWVSPPVTHAVISVQKVPAPTAPGIRSEPSKRNTSALALSSATALRNGSSILSRSRFRFGPSSLRELASDSW